MATLIPYLLIKSPSGVERRLNLRETRYTLGRLAAENDIGLEEDPQSLITRVKHCILERQSGWWYLTDRSTNGTIIQRGDRAQQVQDIAERKVALNHEDVICIQGWKLTFYDFGKTNRLGTRPISQPSQLSQAAASSSFVYKLTQATLFHQTAGQRIAIETRPKVINMLRYMAQRNLENGGEPALCTYEELIQAVWSGEEVGRVAADVNGLANEIRRLLEKHGNQSGKFWLETKSTMGYLLKIDCEY